MKSLVFLCFIALASAGTLKEYPEDEVVPDGIFEDIVNKTIEGLRPIIPDPLLIDELNITLPGGALAGSAGIGQFSLTGLKSFQVTALKVGLTTLQLNFTIVIPAINLNTDYWLQDVLLLELVPLYGGGKANVHLNELTITGTGQAKFTGGFGVSNLRVAIGVGDLVFDIHGLLDNEDFSTLVSAILNDTVGKFINEHQKLISDIVSPIIQALIDFIMSGGGATTVAPTTPAPTTPEPTTEAPTTPEPTTEAPTTPEPTTAAPTTPAPTTPEPTTAAPTTPEPTTEAPTTPEPTTEAPTTPEPTTSAPTTPAPTTPEPTTEAPTTPEPTTEAPTTPEPTTSAPTTPAPTTAAPTTPALTTSEPATTTVST